MRGNSSVYIRISRILLFIILEAIAILMVINSGIVQKYKLSQIIGEVHYFFWDKYASIIEYTNLKRANETLLINNAAILEELYKLKRENSRAQTPTTRDTLYPFSFIEATVIKNSFNSPHNYFIIDKGKKDGIKEEMGVITPNGAVGIILSASQNYSYVLSSLNTTQQVSAKISNTNITGPLHWDGKDFNRATLLEIPQHIKITKGDTIYTSGYSLYYPQDIPIGIIEESTIINGIHHNITVTLLQEYRALTKVMVVLNNNKEEINKLIEKVNEQKF